MNASLNAKSPELSPQKATHHGTRFSLEKTRVGVETICWLRGQNCPAHMFVLTSTKQVLPVEGQGQCSLQFGIRGVKETVVLKITISCWLFLKSHCLKTWGTTDCTVQKMEVVNLSVSPHWCDPALCSLYLGK